MEDDGQIRARIEKLEEEREVLRRQEAAADQPPASQANRLEEIRIELDRLWDLLRQRQALRDAGQDPGQAQERSADTVERYWQ